jgi:protein phosphatase
MGAMPIRTGTTYRTRYAWCLVLGRGYDVQSGAVLTFPEYEVFVVAEALAGRPGQSGEFPVVSSVRNAFSHALAKQSDDALRGAEVLARAIIAANRHFVAMITSDPGHRGCGCTLVAARILDGIVAVAHVGDCRAYRVRNGKVARLTLDHGLIEDSFLQGATLDQLSQLSPHRNVIVRAVGMTDACDVDVRYTGSLPGDAFLLVTGPCASALDNDAIAVAFGDGTDSAADVAERLTEAACGATMGNIAALVVQV